MAKKKKKVEKITNKTIFPKGKPLTVKDIKKINKLTDYLNKNTKTKKK